MTPEPVFTDDLVTLYQGDAMKLLVQLRDSGLQLDALVTDPPYSSGGLHRSDRVAPDANRKYQDSDARKTYPQLAGDGRDQWSYLHWSILWLSVCLEMARPGALLCVFTDWRQLPITTTAIQAGGWIWRGINVWDKGHGARPQLGRFTAQCEFVVWGTAGARKLEGKSYPGLWSVYQSPRSKQHVTQKPLQVLKGLLSPLPPGAMVLDPFAGAGTTLRAAKDMGLRAVGMEIQDAYCSIAAERLRQESLGLEAPRGVPTQPDHTRSEG